MGVGPVQLAPDGLRPSVAVHEEWGRRVRAEYASAAALQHLTLWLIRLEAPHQLTEAALRAVADELDHARASFAVFTAAGGRVLPPHDAASLGLAEGDDLAASALDAIVQLACVNKTLGVALFRSLQAACSVPIARQALDRIVDDEVRHRDLGWELLDWLRTTTLVAEADAVVEDSLRASFARLEDAYGTDPDAEEPVDPAERAWGLAGAQEYSQILLGTYQRELLPRFIERSIDPRGAWAGRAGPRPYLV